MDVSIKTAPIMVPTTLQTEEDIIEDEGDIKGKTSNGLVVSSGFGRLNTAKSSLERVNKSVNIGQIHRTEQILLPK